jgi:predicted HTH transcriptional regulator
LPWQQINFSLAKDLFASISKKFTDRTAKSLGLTIQYQAKDFPSNGAVLLFADHYKEIFPDAIIHLGRFLGTDK